MTLCLEKMLELYFDRLHVEIGLQSADQSYFSRNYIYVVP